MISCLYYRLFINGLWIDRLRIMKITKFEDLPVWKMALKITREIYDITALTRLSKDFALRDQLRRAVISVSANIVEGFEKNNNNEFIRYLKIAKGSAGEVRSHIHIAYTVGYITGEKFEVFNEELQGLSNQIGAFISYLEKLRRSGKFVKK